MHYLYFVRLCAWVSACVCVCLSVCVYVRMRVWSLLITFIFLLTCVRESTCVSKRSRAPFPFLFLFSGGGGGRGVTQMCLSIYIFLFLLLTFWTSPCRNSWAREIPHVNWCNKTFFLVFFWSLNYPFNGGYLQGPVDRVWPIQWRLFARSSRSLSQTGLRANPVSQDLTIFTS